MKTLKLFRCSCCHKWAKDKDDQLINWMPSDTLPETDTISGIYVEFIYCLCPDHKPVAVGTSH